MTEVIAPAWPAEAVPKEPILSAAAFRWSLEDVPPNILQAGNAIFGTRGSMAIALALSHAGIGPGDQVLLPSYHCVAMVDPVIWRGATPVFYRVRNDTAVDLDDVAAAIGPDTRALLVTHYFGFHQDMQPIRELCDRYGLILIEDCAHAFFGMHAGRPIGSFGDYSIGSIWKFLPVYEGGCLVSSKRCLADIRMQSCGALFGAKAFVNALQRAFAYGRLPLVERIVRYPLHGADALWRRMKSQPIEDSRSGAAHEADASNPVFREDWVWKSMSIPSRLIMRLVSMSQAVQRRLTNYERLLNAIGGISRAEPLFCDLPAGVVPQVLPLRIFEPDTVFPVLKAAGVPIIRFGEMLWPAMDRARHPAAIALSREIFQLPCHQELTDSEIDWLAECIRTALSGRGSMPAWQPY